MVTMADSRRNARWQWFNVTCFCLIAGASCASLWFMLISQSSILGMSSRPVDADAEALLVEVSANAYSFVPQPKPMPDFRLAKLSFLESLLEDEEVYATLVQLNDRYESLRGWTPWAENVAELRNTNTSAVLAAVSSDMLTMPVYITGQIHGALDEYHLDRRAVLSRIVNRMDQLVGQLECYAQPKAANQQVVDIITQKGAWCNKHTNRNHCVDKKVQGYLCELFNGSTVASFGEGHGAFVRHVMKTCPQSVRMTGYDGNAFSEVYTDGAVNFMDLTLKQEGIPLFDWVMSFEVAEHIPKKYEEIFLSNVVDHAKVGVVLSWAIPGQGGHGHVNTKSIEDLDFMLDNRGFGLDLDATKKFRGHFKHAWYGHTRIYRRRVPMTEDQLVRHNYWGGYGAPPQLGE